MFLAGKNKDYGSSPQYAYQSSSPIVEIEEEVLCLVLHQLISNHFLKVKRSIFR